MRPLLIVAGPTASGKSSLALHLAGCIATQQLPFSAAELVNCDSLQLYRGFDIGTAKTPARDRHGVSHHLIDVLDAQTISTAGDYARQARATLEEIANRGALPIVVGGTGFYLKALLDGLPELPSRDAGLRARIEDREERRPGSTFRLLQRFDPAAAARIHRGDIQKLTRALEICLLTRGSLPAPAEAAPLTGFEILQLGLDPPRDSLVQAIAERTRHMFAMGLVEEVRGLLARGLSGEEKPFESIGYKQALAHIQGEMTLQAAIESTEVETRQYAKRQRTWFRRDPRMQWLAGFGHDPEIQRQAESLLQAHFSGRSGKGS